MLRGPLKKAQVSDESPASNDAHPEVIVRLPELEKDLRSLSGRECRLLGRLEIRLSHRPNHRSSRILGKFSSR